MVRRADWPKLHYVAHFRTARGGSGVYYQTARAELLAALGHLGLTVLDDVPGHMRLHFHLPRDLEPSLLRTAEYLGYTQALTRASRYRGMGREQKAEHMGRLLLGAQRFGEDCFVFELIWQADERARLQRSPDRRPFEYAAHARSDHPAGRRFRRLSVCDAMLLLNLARVRPGFLVVDPFAGIGGIVQECRRRNLRCVCGDVDPSLAPGLSADGGTSGAYAAMLTPPLRPACPPSAAVAPPSGMPATCRFPTPPQTSW